MHPHHACMVLVTLKWFIFCIVDAHLIEPFETALGPNPLVNGVTILVLRDANMLTIADRLSRTGRRRRAKGWAVRRREYKLATGMINPSDVIALRRRPIRSTPRGTPPAGDPTR